MTHLAEAEYCKNHCLPVGMSCFNRPCLCENGYKTHKESYPDYMGAQTMCKYTLLWMPWRPFHNAFFCGFCCKGETRKPIGNEINPEDMNWQKRDGQP